MTLSRQTRAKGKRDWTAAREKVEREGECRACLATGPLECAHVVARSLGGGQEADSVIPLCPDCHRAQHSGAFDLLPILHREEQIEAVRVLGLARAFRYLGGLAAGEEAA